MTPIHANFSHQRQSANAAHTVGIPWKGSGLTLKAYAEAHGIGRWALGRWSRRFAAAEEVSAPLVMEIVEAAPRRRYWSQAEKEQLVAETCEPGMSVSLVARRRGVDPSLLFRWRRQMLTPAEPTPIFAAVEVADTTPALPLTPPTPCGAGMIEIELAGGRRLRVGRDVDAEALRRVISVLERP